MLLNTTVVIQVEKWGFKLNLKWKGVQVASPKKEEKNYLGYEIVHFKLEQWDLKTKRNKLKVQTPELQLYRYIQTIVDINPVRTLITALESENEERKIMNMVGGLQRVNFCFYLIAKEV